VNANLFTAVAVEDAIFLHSEYNFIQNT